MKLSLWQQFSSNHSSYFSIIGRFETHEKAKATATQLNAWMREIFPDESRKVKGLTSTEVQIRDTYQIAWYEDGLDWNGIPKSIDEVVQSYQYDVFFMCPFETWDSHFPFVELLRKLGAHTIYDYYGEYVISIQLHCVAPDEVTANNLYTSIQKQLSEQYVGFENILWDYRIIDRFWPGDGKIDRNGQELSMSLSFYEGIKVFAFIQYLEQNHYTDITYTFSGTFSRNDEA